MVIRKGRAGWSMLAMRASLLSIPAFCLTGAESIAAAQPPAARGNAPAASPAGSPAASPPPQEIIPASTKPDPVPEELLRASPDGVTADQVGQRAAQTSYTAKAAEQTMRAAAARVDAAWASFLPRITGTARYTRYSTFTPQPFVIDPAAPPISFPAPILNNYLLQGNITIPITDYFFRINQAYTAATRSADALKFDIITARAKSMSDGKTAYYSWMRYRGGLIVAVQTLNDQRTHLNDARNQFTVGNASRADVLRAETAVASAELAVEHARNLAELGEKQVRVAMHMPETQNLTPGEAIELAPPPFQGNVKEFTNEALSSRPEVKSIDANAESARKTSEAQKAGRYPVVSAFGDGIYQNPNPRAIPQTPTWFPSWDLGVQAIWSPNDILVANGNSSDYAARAASLEAQRQVTRDGIEVEVLQRFEGVREADIALDSTKRELASATEAYRVARELFNNGRGTSTTLSDAETELARARIDALNARVDSHVARVALEHALGRDAK